MFNKNKFILLLLISSVTTWSFAALGDDTNARRIVTSKAYVDDTKQVKIPATTNTYTYNTTNRPTADGSVVTTGTIDGTVGQRGIATAPTYDANDNLTNDSWLPTMGAMMNAINSHTPTGTQNTIANYGANGALGSGIATYDGSGTYAPATDAGKIATAAAVETKQDKIIAGTAGNVVTYTGTAGSVGSVAVASAPSYTGNTLNNGGSLANITAVETKQNKIDATSDGSNSTPNYVYDATTNQYAAGSVITTTTTAGTVGQLGIATAPVSDGNGGYSNGDWLPTVNAMMNAISSATPTITGTQNTIANYGANGALGSGIATYDGSGTYAPATDAGKIATAAAVETKQDLIPAATSSGAVKIVTYPAYGASDGAIGTLTLDTTSLTASHTVVPSSYLVKSQIDSLLLSKETTDSIIRTDADNARIRLDWATGSNTGTLNLFRIPGLIKSDNEDESAFATEVLTTTPFISSAPTMSTLAYALSGLSDAKQNVLTANISNNQATRIVTYPTYGQSDGAIGSRDIVTTFTPKSGTLDTDGIPTAGAVKVETDSKQSKISATNISYLPQTSTTADGSVITTTGVAGTVSQRGIATAPVPNGNGGYSNGNWLPTVNAMMNAINTATNTLTWTATETTAVGNYSTTFNGTAGNWPVADAGKLIDATGLATALSNKQNILPAKLVSGDTAPYGGMTIDLTAESGVVGTRYITKGGMDALTQKSDAPAVIDYVIGNFDSMSTFTSATFGDNTTTSQNYIRDALVSLETLKEVYDWLSLSIEANSVPTGTVGYVATYLPHTNNDPNGEGKVGGEVAIYSGPTAQTPYNATNDANKLASAGFVETKQNKIDATSDGTGNTPNYVYDSSTNPSAAGSVVTTTTTAGVTGQVGIATAPTRDNNGDLTNENWIPTMGAVETMVSNADLSSHKVNGQPLSNTQITLYGKSSTASGTAWKEVTLYDYSDPSNLTPSQIPELVTGMVIIVKPDNTASSMTHIRITNISTDRPKNAKYNGENIPSSVMSKVWNASSPTVWMYNGTTWDYVAGGKEDILRSLNWATNEATATNAYSTTFNDTTGNWPTFDEDKNVKGASFAQGLALKQNKIDATSDGTGNTPNYVYDLSTNPSAAGSVVTTTTTAGATGQVGIATAPTRDNNGDLTNENWIPTMGAVESMVTATDVSSNAINGIPLSTGGYFYGTSDTAATETTKVVSIPSIPSTTGTNPPTGIMIIVKPDHTSTAGNSLLQLNNFNAKRMRRNNSNISESFDSYVWNENYPTVWMYDGTYWEYIGGYDYNSNTTYSIMTVASGRGGTGTSLNTLSAENLKAIIHGTKLTDAAVSPITFTPTNAAIDASSDTIMSALGKLQGQVSNRVSTTQSTGYQVLTTGTDGAVTAEYISVPVTTSGTGRPTSSNAPTGTAAIWIE